MDHDNNNKSLAEKAESEPARAIPPPSIFSKMPPIDLTWVVIVISLFALLDHTLQGFKSP